MKKRCKCGSEAVYEWGALNVCELCAVRHMGAMFYEKGITCFCCGAERLRFKDNIGVFYCSLGCMLKSWGYEEITETGDETD